MLRTTAAQHEIQRSRKAAQNCHKGQNNEVGHAENYYVNPGLRWWWVTITTCLAAALTLSLGFWQLRRAAEKQAYVDAMQLAALQPPMADSEWLRAQDALPVLHRPARLRGTWVAGRTVFLDNRQMNAKVGFYVLTPLQMSGTGEVVMVQRGWAPRNFVDRTQLPPVESPAGEVEITGRIALPPSKLYELGGASAGAIRQNLDLAQFRVETGLALATGLTVVQTGSASEGLLRDWPVVNAGVEKHQGYAAQWFALSALVVGLYAWFQLRRRKPLPKDTDPHV